MTKRAIVAAAVAALGAGAAWLSGCAADDTRPPAIDGGTGGEGGEGGVADDGGPADAPAEAGPCGCVASGVCEPGDWLFLCGKGGEACKLCLTGAACIDGACVADPSTCVEALKEEGLGAHCENDAQCATDEWCATSCCDPGGACFAVWKCVGKRAPGEPCDRDGGDRQCASGVCEPGGPRVPVADQSSPTVVRV